MKHLKLGILFVVLLGTFVTAQAAFIEGMGGIYAYQDNLDYSKLRGQGIKNIPEVSDPGTPSVIANKGIKLSYVGLRGYFEILSFLRFGAEFAGGFNFVSENEFFDAGSIITALFLQLSFIPILKFELGMGYNFLNLKLNDAIEKAGTTIESQGFFYAFPRVVIGFTIGYFGIQLFGGLTVPMRENIWDALVKKGSLTNLYHIGVNILLSEELFSLI